jgi:hypothetical protein
VEALAIPADAKASVLGGAARRLLGLPAMP